MKFHVRLQNIDSSYVLGTVTGKSLIKHNYTLECITKKDGVLSRSIISKFYLTSLVINVTSDSSKYLATNISQRRPFTRSGRYVPSTFSLVPYFQDQNITLDPPACGRSLRRVVPRISRYFLRLHADSTMTLSLSVQAASSTLPNSLLHSLSDKQAFSCNLSMSFCASPLVEYEILLYLYISESLLRRCHFTAM